MMNRKSVISSFIYQFIEKIAVKGIGLVISVILARLLDPNTFGLLAIISVFMNLAQNFVTSGLGTALVQNRTTEENDYSTVFFLSLGIAIVLDVVLFVSAPVIAAFYENDTLIWPLRVMSLSLPLGALNSVQNAKLQREMRFKMAMHCNLIATVISGVIGVAAAYLGAELWALVIYSLSGTIIVTVCMLIADKWYPRFVFSIARVKVFWEFGWKMLVSGLLCSLYNDARSLIIGRKYSTEDLAYYNRGQQFPEVIASTLDISIQTVMLPVMSSEQNSTERLNEMLLKTLSISMFVVTPVMLGLAAVAQTLIPLLLTEKWNASIPLLVVFCISYLTLPVMTTNLSLIKAMGRSDIYMRTEVVRRLAMLVVLLITVLCFDSVMVIALGYALSSVIDICIIIAAVKKLTGLGWMKQLRSIWKTLLAGAIMATVVCLANTLAIGKVWKLIFQVLMGIGIYAGCSAILKIEPFSYIISLLKKFINS